MRNDASLRSCCWWWLTAAVAAVLLGPVPTAGAADIYRILGVPVDATAESAVAARERAIDAGQREGLVRLMRRLTSPTAHDRLPDVGALQIERYVNSFEIAEEKVGPTRYLATPDARRRSRPPSPTPASRSAPCPATTTPFIRMRTRHAQRTRPFGRAFAWPSGSVSPSS